MKALRQEKEERAGAPDEAATGDERKVNVPSRKDMLAIILAMFELFLPAILGLILVGVVVALILH
jgi:hypothetical protein